jgi:hydroxymethylpyrimidine pyrophosphatase-like HAD family hydrolase
MPSPRILALDLDGTLVCRDGTVHPDDLAAVAAAQAAGIQVSIVTGRLYSGVRELAQRLGIRGTVVCADGAELVDPLTHRVVAHRRIEGAASRFLWEQLAAHELALFVMAEERIRYDARGDGLAPYVRNWTQQMERVPSVLELPHGTGAPGLSLLVAVGRPEAVEPTVAALREDGRFEVDSFDVRQAPGAPPVDGLRGLLAHAAGVDKGRAIADLAAQHGLGVDAVAAVGDWVNDIPMLRAAGRSFVMGGAEPAVTAAADEVLEARAWHGGGVAEAVRRVWGLG